MGQYWKTVVGNKAYETTGFVKIMEHSWILNSYVRGVCALIQDIPQRVLWVGDYANDVIPNIKDKTLRNICDGAYRMCWRSEKKEIQPIEDYDDIPDGVELPDMRAGYLLNRSKNEYLDLAKYVERCTDSEGWCINPLSLLTAVPGDNGQGGGDYRSDVGMEFVGYWCADVIEYTRDRSKIKGLSEICPKFTEC